MPPQLLMAFAGAAAQGVTTFYNTNKLAKKYKKAAQEIRANAEKYSGHNADRQMSNAGQREGVAQTNLALDTNMNNLGNANLSMANQANNANLANNALLTGQSMGRANKATELNSKYNKATADAQNMLSKAQTDYNVGMQTAQTAFQGLGNLANLGGQTGAAQGLITSDERVKEYNNHSGLPKADAADALRQIESVEYKYKPETGLDQDKHVGVTAQSLEGTAFDDTVVENGGVKELDKNKLLADWPEMVQAIEPRLRLLEELREKVGNLRNKE